MVGQGQEPRDLGRMIALVAKGWPRRSWMRRWRRLLPQNTRSTGAVAIHRLPGSSASIA
jgi:hypothetical protein